MSSDLDECYSVETEYDDRGEDGSGSGTDDQEDMSDEMDEVGSPKCERQQILCQVGRWSGLVMKWNEFLLL
jgi:hypothetical protein